MFVSYQPQPKPAASLSGGQTGTSHNSPLFKLTLTLKIHRSPIVFFPNQQKTKQIDCQGAKQLSLHKLQAHYHKYCEEEFHIHLNAAIRPQRKASKLSQKLFSPRKIRPGPGFHPGTTAYSGQSLYQRSDQFSFTETYRTLRISPKSGCLPQKC